MLDKNGLPYPPSSHHAHGAAAFSAAFPHLDPRGAAAAAGWGAAAAAAAAEHSAAAAAAAAVRFHPEAVAAHQAAAASAYGNLQPPHSQAA